MRIDTLGSTMCTAIECTPNGVWLTVPYPNGESREVFLSVHMIGTIAEGIDKVARREKARKEEAVR